MPLLSMGNKAELYYERVAGDPALLVLVFLHEGLGCSEMWRDFPERVCRAGGCEGLVYDRQGYGGSSPLQTARSIHYSHEYALNELPEVLAALLPERDYWLIGHSDGGSIALIHAAERPVRLRGVITEAAHVFVEEITLDGIRAARAAYAMGKLNGLRRYHGNKTDGIFAAWADTWLEPSFAYWNIEYLLPAITCPVLALQGGKDQYGSAAQLAAITSRVGDSRSQLLPACGHAPHSEAADLTLSAVLKFLAVDCAARKQHIVRVEGL